MRTKDTKRQSGRAQRLSMALTAALACLGLSAAIAQAGDLEVLSFSAPALNADQTLSTTGGARPYELQNNFAFNEIEDWPAENVKDLSFDLPPGIVGNAAAFPRCPLEYFDDRSEQRCPPETQIGVAKVLIRTDSLHLQNDPIFNLEPPNGMPAQFGFMIQPSLIHVNFHVRTGSDYGVTATLHNLSNTAPLVESAVSIWGVPGEHTGGPFATFLSNPTSCDRPLLNTMEMTTWQQPNEPIFGAAFNAAAMSECDQLGFAPSVEAKPTTDLADSPSGLDFHLQIPQNQSATGRAVAHLRESKVVLPTSLAVNPSSANGLGACDLSQIGYTGLGDERQTLTYNLDLANSFTVGLGASTTAPIAADANRTQVAAAIETLPGLGDNVSVQGAPGGWTITFGGDLAGTDVPVLTGTVTDVAHQKIEITGTGGGFNLQSGGDDTAATFDASFGLGDTSLIPVSNVSRQLVGGETIEGPGITPGTKITAYFLGRINISQPTTEKQPPVDGEPPVHLNTILPLDSSATEIQTALEGLPAIGAGSVAVGGPSFNGSTRSFTVLGTGALAGTEPAFTATSSLTGSGAGVMISPAPSTHPLQVTTNTEAGEPQFTPDPANCPDASTLGTVHIESPAVIDHPLKGTVYLATPHQNPFGSLLAIYITVDDPKTGIVVKLPGLIETDSKTGQLTATVSEAPQLPFEDLTLKFFKGAVAPLKTDIACGTSEVTTDMVPWSSPEGATMHPSDSFSITKGAGEGTCVKDEASAPNSPTFKAGTLGTNAGAYSPFNLKLTRADGTQQLTGIETTLPKGLVAKFAGVTSCSDAALKAAESKNGKDELANPSCPVGSRVGTVEVGAGAGPTPYYTQGTAYLSGPYKGAPLSISVITPAVAGPFDLGTVVIRNAVYIDHATAQGRAVSDPFPHILEGIPLDLRSINLTLDRAEFTKNPTRCSEQAITGSASALPGQSARLSSRFQVGDCSKLSFKPKLKLALKGKVHRRAHPSLRATLTARAGDANIARAQVKLPKAAFLDNAHIGEICTRVQFAAHQCPPGSIYGYASATTPILDYELTGPVYLRSSSNPLPALVVGFTGPADQPIEVELAGKTDSVKGALRNTFEAVPDVPVTKFSLTLFGGKKGLIEMSSGFCAHPEASVKFDGQNGKTYDTTPKVRAKCGKLGKGNKPKHSKKRSHG